MSCDTTHLPDCPEKVTLEWLKSVLKDEDIISFEMTKKLLTATTSKLNVTLSYKDEEAAKAVGKPKYILLKGGFSKEMFAVPGYKEMLLRMYYREVDFFNNYAHTVDPQRGPKVPKSYWAGSTPDQAIIIMEDLSRNGYVFGEPRRTYSLESVKVGVEQLAALHGTTWGWTTEDHPWVQKPIYDETVYALLGLWDELVGPEDRPKLPAIVADKDLAKRAVDAYFDKRNPRFRCLVHGDPHSGNTFIVADDETQFRFLDWQVVHVDSCFHDVAYFISSMLTVEERRKHEWEILAHYLKALAASGGPTFTVDDPEVIVEFRKCMVTGYGWILTPYPMQGEERVRAMAARYSQAIVDHKTMQLLTGEDKE